MENIKMKRNLRELGGYRNKEGKKVRDLCLFRSGNLNDLSKEEEVLLSQLDIKDIVDFRSDEEIYANPYQITFECQYHHVTALHTKDGLENFYFFMLINENSTEEEIIEASKFVRDGYRYLPFQNQAYRKVFDLMLTSDKGILFHCSSGKDRTGLMAALILKALDIDDKIIMKDYLSSNQNVIENTLRHINEMKFTGTLKDTVIYCCTVHEELLFSAYEEILSKYGSWNRYFEEEYGLNTEKLTLLKNKYLILN